MLDTTWFTGWLLLFFCLWGGFWGFCVSSVGLEKAIFGSGCNVSVRGNTRLTVLWLSARCRVQRFNRKMLFHVPGTLGSTANRAVKLERDPQPELQLPGGAERIDTCSHPDAVHVVTCASSAVNLPGASLQ